MGDAVNERLPDVDSATLVRLLGVSGKVVYDLTKAGIIERLPGKMFALEDAVQRYCQHLRGQVAGVAEADGMVDSPSMTRIGHAEL